MLNTLKAHIMTIFQRFSAVLLLLFFGLFLAACGNKSESNDNNENSSIQSQNPPPGMMTIPTVERPVAPTPPDNVWVFSLFNKHLAMILHEGNIYMKRIAPVVMVLTVRANCLIHWGQIWHLHTIMMGILGIIPIKLILRRSGMGAILPETCLLSMTNSIQRKFCWSWLISKRGGTKKIWTSN